MSRHGRFSTTNDLESSFKDQGTKLVWFYVSVPFLGEDFHDIVILSTPQASEKHLTKDKPTRLLHDMAVDSWLPFFEKGLMCCSNGFSVILNQPL